MAVRPKGSRIGCQIGIVFFSFERSQERLDWCNRMAPVLQTVRSIGIQVLGIREAQPRTVSINRLVVKTQSSIRNKNTFSCCVERLRFLWRSSETAVRGVDDYSITTLKRTRAADKVQDGRNGCLIYYPFLSVTITIN